MDEKILEIMKKIIIRNPIDYAEAYFNHGEKGGMEATNLYNEALRKHLKQYDFEWEYKIESHYVYIFIWNEKREITEEELQEVKVQLERLW